MALVVALTSGAVASVGTLIVQTRLERQKDDLRRAEHREEAKVRRDERLAEAAERRADRLNEQRVALYAEVLAWAETSSRQTDLPSAVLTARVKILAGDAVRKEFADLVRARSHVNKADLISDPAAMERLAKFTGLESDDLRARLRSDLGGEWVKVFFGADELEQVCRAELLSLTVAWP